MSLNRHPVVVIDNGTGYTKMGFAGNNEPNFVIPTTINTRDQPQRRGIDDLDFTIGQNPLPGYSASWPIRHGQVDNWDLMEKFHQASIYQYLKCDPEDHYFLVLSI